MNLNRIDVEIEKLRALKQDPEERIKDLPESYKSAIRGVVRNQNWQLGADIYRLKSLKKALQEGKIDTLIRLAMRHKWKKLSTIDLEMRK